MSEPPKKPEPSKDTDQAKKMEPRTAGAPPNREDVFYNPLPDHPDDETPEGDSSDGKRITWQEALKEKAKRLSIQLLNKNKDDKPNDGKEDGDGKGTKT